MPGNQLDLPEDDEETGAGYPHGSIRTMPSPSPGTFRLLPPAGDHAHVPGTGVRDDSAHMLQMVRLPYDHRSISHEKKMLRSRSLARFPFL